MRESRENSRIVWGVRVGERGAAPPSPQRERGERKPKFLRRKKKLSPFFIRDVFFTRNVYNCLSSFSFIRVRKIFQARE